MELNRDEVRKHIHDTNDCWFQAYNPMLTGTRHDELEKKFQCGPLDLKTSYHVLFTDAEREHLTFEYFHPYQHFPEALVYQTADSLDRMLGLKT